MGIAASELPGAAFPGDDGSQGVGVAWGGSWFGLASWGLGIGRWCS